MKFNPLNDHVVIYQFKFNDIDRNSGLGCVLDVGPGWKDEDGIRNSMSVQVGDIVLFRWDAGYRIKFPVPESVEIPMSDLFNKWYGTYEGNTTEYARFSWNLKMDDVLLIRDEDVMCIVEDVKSLEGKLPEAVSHCEIERPSNRDTEEREERTR